MNSAENITRRLFEARRSKILKEGYGEMDTKELVQKAQAGDQYAFETLLNNHEHFMYKMTKKWILDTGDEDDVRQIANIGFWEAVKKWNGSGDFEAFAGMIIKNRLSDALRKDDAGKVKISTKATSLDQKINNDLGTGQEYDLYDITPDRSTPSSEDTYIGKDSATKIAKFMKDNLSDVERQVMLLYTQGYKMAEISSKLAIPYKRAENSLMRAKGKLKDFMRSNGIRESRSLRESNELSLREKRMIRNILTKIMDEEKMRRC